MTSRLLLLLFAPACVLTPTSGDEPTRRDPIDFTGMASRPNAPIRIQAMNHGTRAFETVASFRGDTRQWASEPDLFQWQRIGVRLADRYWVPPGASCQTGGMANLRVQEINEDGTLLDLATFDAAGKDCLDEKLAEGDHPVSAGNQCKRAQATIVLFAPPQCVPARTVDASPPEVTIRLSNAKQAFERRPGDPTSSVAVHRTLPLTVTALARDRDGAVAAIGLAGRVRLTCRNSAGVVDINDVPLSSTVSRTLTPGVLADIAIETSRTLDVPTLLATGCDAGFTLVSASGIATARGTTLAFTGVTAEIRFTL